MTIIVTGNTVTAVEKGYAAAVAGDKVIDLKNRTVMPGLIDSHVHLESQLSPSERLNSFTMNPADVAFQSTVYAKTTLMAGFTTVRDVGGTGVNISLRNAIRKGLVVGPHMYTAGKIISSTGGNSPSYKTSNFNEGDVLTVRVSLRWALNSLHRFSSISSGEIFFLPTNNLNLDSDPSRWRLPLRLFESTKSS